MLLLREGQLFNEELLLVLELPDAALVRVAALRLVGQLAVERLLGGLAAGTHQLLAVLRG